ncbi:MAG: acyl-CoA dehydrogenase family protein [Candidatus Stahlbacteria bacterium]|nr:acyl-CoA dehydrogenase family protein [Candidatus Stahlbacteria bacterium]
MDYFISAEQRRLKEIAKRIVTEKVIPQRSIMDKEDKFPQEIMQELAHTGLFKIFIPPEYGGTATGIMDLCLVVEELARACAGVGTAYAATALASTPIILFGNQEQKSKYLSKVATGTLASFGLTESEAGSDASSVKTKAVKDGEFYILNGTKQWITNGGVADVFSIFVSTNPARGARGMSAIIVDKGMPGFSIGKIEDKLGIRASNTAELIFEDCSVPVSNLLGREGAGFLVAMRTFDYTRPGVGALSVGVAQGAIDELMRYKKVIDFGRSQFMIAELVSKVEAARAFVYAMARYADSGARDISKWSAMAKLFASDVAMEVTTKAVEIFNLAGCTEKYPIEKMFRDAKITQIYEGTNEIQKFVIANSI